MNFGTVDIVDIVDIPHKRVILYGGIKYGNLLCKWKRVSNNQKDYFK